MSVICRNKIDNKFKAFVKGSPEKISELCIKSTLPNDFQDILMKYTKDGYRVIALSVKDLDGMTYRTSQTIQRQDVEKDLTFLGLLIMENKLKYGRGQYSTVYM